jgi:Predicted phosphatase homologous to the C-terminal domain of histone macroH2A1
MQIEVIKSSILEVDADVIVNPANSLGLMGGGVAGVIKRFGGEEIEKEAVQKAPIPVGSAVLTTAGKLKLKGVIHAPTMEKPATESSEEKVRKAVRASLELADSLGFETLAMPGMGTGVGGLPKELSAKAILEEIKNFKPKSLKKVILVDIDPEMVQAWQKNL